MQKTTHSLVSGFFCVKNGIYCEAQRERAEAFAGVGLRKQDKQGKTPLNASEKESAEQSGFADE